MGNFQDHLQQSKALREVDPSQVRVHTFGNPFKLKQQDQVNIHNEKVFLKASTFYSLSNIHSVFSSRQLIFYGSLYLYYISVHCEPTQKLKTLD